MAQNNAQTVANGSFDTQKTHDINSAILEAAIADYEAIASTFATNAILDDKVRQQYVKHIKEISDQVRQEVADGNMTVKDGAEYCSALRDKLFVEYRKYTSAVGVAKAERLKLTAKGFDFYLNKYAQAQFGKNFDTLTTEERNAVYYTVLKKAGGGNADVTTKVRKLRVSARVAILFTAILATGEVIGAKDKVKEVARQGSIIVSANFRPPSF
jgi:ribosomal protein L16 Arg81 hydroxylase